MAVSVEQSRSPAPAHGWQKRFLAMLPAILTHARVAFRHLKGDNRDDMVEEVVANSFVAFARLAQLGKIDLAYPSVLARYAVVQALDGRRVGSRLNIREVTSPYAQKMKGIHLERLDKYDDVEDQWREIVVEDRRCGPFPGTGKSAYSKALGAETGRPTLILDVGSLMGSLVGATEANVRQALRIADAMAPCILLVDEVEKALSGVASSGSTDSGVSARLFGTLLTWLADHQSDVFTICTCNDIAKLPPEFSRAERFDGIFFLDLPGVQQKRAIWRLYLDLFGLDVQRPRPVDAQWTGAEVRACCRLAALLDVPLVEAARNVVPVAVTTAESVQRLRAWASGRCLNADAPGGIYTANPNSGVETNPGRTVRRDPSSN